MKISPLHLAGIFFALFAINSSATVRYVNLNSPNATPPFDGWSIAATNIQDAVDAAVDGDLIVVSNGVYNTGGRVVFGSLTNRVAINKAVTVQSLNGSAATVIRGNPVLGNSAVRCAYLTNGAALIGFTLTNGATRTSGDNFREVSGGGVWCESTNAALSNCVVIGNLAGYAGGGVSGGTLSYCTISRNEDGHPIYGGGTYLSVLYDCVLTRNSGYYGGGAYGGMLGRCLLTNNGAGYGGGASYAVLTNCTVTRNVSSTGGGVDHSTLVNCLVIQNFVADLNIGSGANVSTLINCTITGNSSFDQIGLAHGAANCQLTNCIVYGNSDGGNYSGGTLSYCCVTPLPSGGVGNITNAPLFVSQADGNFHLQFNSPCINSGNNSYVANTMDFDGNPRIVGGTVDIGAYEFQSPSSILPYAWAQQFGLPSDGSADFTDNDADGLNNWQEWIAGTVPTNSLSVLTMFSPSNNVTGLKISWQSVTNRNYFLQRSSDLSAQPAFSAIQSNIVGQAGTTVYTDAIATNSGSYFYRVGVQ